MSSRPFPAQNAPQHSPPLVTAEQNSQNLQPRVRRRNRVINSCLECRRRKLKCDKKQPCANCTKISRQCVFIAPGLDPDAQARLAEVKEKMGILERSLEDKVARRAPSSHGPSSASIKLPGQEASYSDQEDDEYTRDLDPSHLVTEDAAYYEDEGNDDIVDLGLAMGKVRITDRIGGLVRPRFSEELAQALSELPKSTTPNVLPVSGQDPLSLAPSRDYVAPSSSFFFAPGIERTSLMTHLPSKVLVDKLIAHYWNAVHVIARTVHRPSFERHYHKFWIDVESGVEPRASFQAVIFAVLLSSIVSMSEDKVLTEFGVEKQSLVDNFREGTEAALARANFLRTTKLETLQAFVMYLVSLIFFFLTDLEDPPLHNVLLYTLSQDFLDLSSCNFQVFTFFIQIPLCRNEVSRAHSALTGTLIRLAECMGLHRDPTTYSTSPIEIHVRRLVWYQICFLDLRTCEATGPRPQIRPDDYDTQFPLNIDDSDLDRAENGESGVDVRNDRTYFTDMTVTRMRFECYEMHRVLWNERPKLETRRAEGERKVTITSLLSRVQYFKAAMEKTYVPMLRKTVPLHALAAEIYGILSDRLYILLLQKYLSSDRKKMPARLRQLVMSAAVMILEHSMTIEQQPALSTWSWYVGALHQYHVALLLLNELYAGPREPALEQRVWKCLDFAFDIPSGMSGVEKVRTVLSDLVGKTQCYAKMKRLRAPCNMPHAGPRTHTPGYQARLQEAREERERNVNLQQTLPPQQQPYFLHGPQAQATPFPGSMPNTDWGTIDLPTSTINFQMPQQPPPISKSAIHNGLDSTTPVGGLMPVNMMGNDASTPGAAIYGTVAGGTANSSPMDALNDLDWNAVEQMFGSAEMGVGNMLIPPFTFPQFSATQLQWPTQEDLQ